MNPPTGGVPLPALTPNDDTKLDLRDLFADPADAVAPGVRMPSGAAMEPDGAAPAVSDENAVAARPDEPHASGAGNKTRKTRKKRERNREGVMTLGEHLTELRDRIIRAFAGVAVMSVVGWAFSEPVFRLLQEPFLKASRQQDGLMSITFNGVVSAFNVRLQIACFLGLVLSCPWWSYQIWAFINPGLKRRERWTAVAFIAASVPLFLTGAGLAWYFLPQAIAILTGFAPADTATLLSADVYFDFVMRMTLAFGLSFLLPVVMVALTMMDVVSSRGWLGHWRVAVLVAFVFAAVATPTGDVGTLCALALPICGIYFAAIAVCWGYERVQLLRIMRMTGERTRLGRMRDRMRTRLGRGRRGAGRRTVASGIGEGGR